MIEAKGLQKRYGNKQILKDISFEVLTGECLAITGKNGSGKSTLLRLLVGLEPPDAGIIRYNGVNVDTVMPNNIKMQLGAFVDEAILLEDLTGAAYIDFVAGLYRLRGYQDRLQQLREIFEFTSDKDFFDKIIRDYSLGMKRKVAIISSVLHNPRYLILDEAFSSLDYDVVKRFTQFLRERDSNTTLIVTSHVLPYLQELLDRAIVLDAGELIFYGSGEEFRKLDLPFLTASPIAE